MDVQKLTADTRKITGRKVKRLRNDGVIPANIFGAGVKSTNIKVDEKKFRNVFEKTGETGIIDLKIGKKNRSVLVSQVQTHPVTDDILHVDFREVDLTKKITTMVPLELTGESPAEKADLGTVVAYLDEVEVEAKPTDLPESFEIDISVLEDVDDEIKISDIKHDPKKITITNDKDQVIVRVQPPQKEEEIVVAATEEQEEEEAGEAEGAEDAAQGETQGEQDESSE